MSERGYCGIGIVQGKTVENLGGLWRSAHILGADFIFTVGRRYGKRHPTDVTNARVHVPLFEFESFDDFMRSGIPSGAQLVGVECSGVVSEPSELPAYAHPPRAVYLLGAEDCGLPLSAQRACHALASIPSEFDNSLNVASAGTVVLYDRAAKASAVREEER